jgi:hypothetical protein
VAELFARYVLVIAVPCHVPLVIVPTVASEERLVTLGLTGTNPQSAS